MQALAAWDKSCPIACVVIHPCCRPRTRQEIQGAGGPAWHLPGLMAPLEPHSRKSLGHQGQRTKARARRAVAEGAQHGRRLAHESRELSPASETEAQCIGPGSERMHALTEST